MPFFRYENWKPTAESIRLLDLANSVIEEFQRDGFTLTVRQLYYQLVGKDLIDNDTASYRMVLNVVRRGRRAGFIDWNAIEDRTRNLRDLSHWETAKEVVEGASKWFNLDLWKDQDNRPEVWVEKDALLGVVERVCQKNDVPFFSCRGFVSDSEAWIAAQRLNKWILGDRKRKDKGEKAAQVPYVLHLSDHDPSGVFMTEDLEKRLGLFMGWKRPFPIIRLALTLAQIDEYGLPPNPAKKKDKRYKAYVAKYDTTSSWELDALSPAVIEGLIRGQLEKIRDAKKWKVRIKKEARFRDELGQIGEQWEDVCDNFVV